MPDDRVAAVRPGRGRRRRRATAALGRGDACSSTSGHSLARGWTRFGSSANGVARRLRDEEVHRRDGRGAAAGAARADQPALPLQRAHHDRLSGPDRAGRSRADAAAADGGPAPACCGPTSAWRRSIRNFGSCARTWTSSRRVSRSGSTCGIDVPADLLRGAGAAADPATAGRKRRQARRLAGRRRRHACRSSRGGSLTPPASHVAASSTVRDHAAQRRAHACRDGHRVGRHRRSPTSSAAWRWRTASGRRSRSRSLRRWRAGASPCCHWSCRALEAAHARAECTS